MTDWGYNDDSANGNQGNTEPNGPKALREAYEAMKKQNDELSQKLTSFLEDQQKQKMASVFETLGVPGAATAYQGPADPKAAEEWVTSMKSIFGGNQGNAPVAENAQTEQMVPPNGQIPPSMQAQFERMANAGTDGTPQGNFEAAQSSVNGASSTDDIIAAFQRMQRM